MNATATKAPAQSESTQTETAVSRKPTTPETPQQMPQWADTAVPAIQFSLKVNPPNDKYEQEADRVATQVMRMPKPTVQRKTCACGQPAGPDGMCADCKRKQLGIQRLAKGDGAKTAVPPIVNQVLSQPGRPLDGNTRHFMESRFGRDFSGVRTHTGGIAAQSAHSINARAYTVGQNIIFGSDQYRPNTMTGRKLLSHELTHTIQQGAVPQLGESQSHLSTNSNKMPTLIQREVGEDLVASSSDVLARISNRVNAADRRAEAIVRVLRRINAVIPQVNVPPQVAQLRTLIENEPLFRAGVVTLVRLIELGLEFNPGAGRDSPLNRFVYTCRCGWIDMGHLFISAAVSFVAGFLLRLIPGLRAQLGGVRNGAEASLIIGWFMEHFQEVFRQFVSGPFGGLLSLAPTAVQEAIMGNVRSAFTVEDLPSDKYGADIGQEALVAASGLLSLFGPEPFDIHYRMTEFFSDCGAVYPTGQTRTAMVEETIGPGPLPRQHFSTEPVRLTSAFGLCPVPETTCPPVNERAWEQAHPAGMIDEASDSTTLWNFSVNASALKAEHQQRLRLAAANLPSRAMIMVEGYASCSGSSRLNERLARSRADSVVTFLRAQRPDLRIGTLYFGERVPDPPVTAGNGEAMARNRRVKIYIVDIARTRFGLPAFQLPTQAPLPMPVTASAPADTNAESEQE